MPDVVLVPDTLTTAETVFAQSLGGHVPVFRDVLTAYALELKKAGRVGGEAFGVTPVMRAEVRAPAPAARSGDRGQRIRGRQSDRGRAAGL